MKAYLSFFKIWVLSGLQYRAAAYAGIATQFAFGFMTILMFNAFYTGNPDGFPMSFPQLSAYVWLQQALLTLYMAWFFDHEIFGSISNGNVAYDLCRPVGIYEMWFVRSVASRVYRVLLRCAPILIVAALLPAPYGLMPPVNAAAFGWFVLSMLLGLLIMVSINMLIYISAFYTVSSLGIRILSTSVIEFLSGAVIPIPFMPEGVQRVLNLLPFASTQNTPFLIYNGFVSGSELYFSLLAQLAWLVILFLTGKLLIRNALKRVVVQGG